MREANMEVVCGTTGDVTRAISTREVGFRQPPKRESVEPSMTIDMHAHYLPVGLVEAMERRTSAPSIETMPNGEQRRNMPAGNTLPFSRETYTDMERRLDFMEDAGVGCQVLSLGLLFGIHSLPLDEAAPLAKLFNDDLGALCRRHPDHFMGIALLPMADVAAAAEEFRRARTGLGLLGAILPANAFVSADEAAKLRPIFEAGEELGSHFFVHPGRRSDEVPPPGGGRPQSTYSDNMLARQALEVQARLAQATVTLLLSDFLDPYPNVTVHVANLGGTLPMVIERMDHTAELRSPGEPLPSSRMRRVYVDCSSLGPRAIELAVAVFGADRLLFGTDCPIFRTDRTLAAVGAANINDDEL